MFVRYWMVSIIWNVPLEIRFIKIVGLENDNLNQLCQLKRTLQIYKLNYILKSLNIVHYIKITASEIK